MPTRDADRAGRAAAAAASGLRRRPPRRRAAASACGRQRRPPEVDLARSVHPREVEAEADRGEQREADAGRDPPRALVVLERGERDADERADDARDLHGGRAVAGGDAEDDRDHRRRARDRRDHAHRADLHAAVVGVEPEPCRRSTAAIAKQHLPAARPLAADRDRDRDRDHAADLGPEQHAERAERARPIRVRRSRRRPRRGSRRARAGAASIDRSRRGDRVELVRVVEDGRLGRAGRACVVVRRRRSAASSARCAARRALRRAARSAAAPRWTWPSSRPSSVGGNAGPASELERPADVVDERGGEQRGSARSRGCSCAVSRQSVATPTVCSSSPPA